jgi:hypothetical protein
MVSKPETIFWVPRKMVSLVKKIFWFAKTIVSGIESMVLVTHTIFTATGTTVTAAQKWSPSCRPCSDVMNFAEGIDSDLSSPLQPDNLLPPMPIFRPKEANLCYAVMEFGLLKHRGGYSCAPTAFRRTALPSELLSG